MVNAFRWAKLGAGKSRIRFDEGEVSSAKSRCGGLLRKGLVAVCALVVSGSAGAATWWVATDGSDAAAGSEEAPFATLSNAFAHASGETRDTIRIKDGTYPSTGAIIVNKPVEIVGNDADRSQVVIDGEKTKALLGISHADVFVHGITFANGGSTATIPNVSHPSFFACNFEMSAGVVSNCTIKSGKSQYTGNLAMMAGAPKLIDCLLDNGAMNDSGSLACRGGGVKMSGSAELINCVVTNCSAMLGAGVYMESSTKLYGCTVVGNRVRSDASNAGLYVSGSAVVSNCVVRDNVTSDAKPVPARGVYQTGGTIINTLITGHAASNGGGVYKTNGSLVNCTVAGNTATQAGAGVYQTGGSLVNTAVGSLTSMDAVKKTGGTASHSCGTGLTTDANGNFGVNPIFRDEANGDYTLKGSSPCVDAGEEKAWHADAKDISGSNARVLDGNGDGIAAVDIGAYEYDPAQAPLDLSFSAVTEAGDDLPRTAVFKPCLEGAYGEITKVVWDFGDGTTVEGTTLEPVEHDFTAAGFYTATLTVTTTEAGVMASEMVDAVKIKPTTVYMSTTGSATPPYDNPARATASLADALSALAVPSTGRARIIIADGTYDAVSPRPTLDFPVEIVGNDADPTVVTFDGGSKRGFFFVDNADAFVHGIRFYKGYMAESTPFSGAASFSGSSLVMRYGVVSNCVYESCSGTYFGGISLQGSAKLYDTAISGASSSDWGGAALGGGLRIYGTATAENCTITTSSCKIGSGAGVHGGTMRNCRVFGNTGASSGGGLYVSGGTAENCVVVSNSMASGGLGGGAYVCGGTLRNSLVAWNSTPSGTGSGAYMTSGNIQNCTVAENDGGTVCNGVYLKGGTLVNSAVSGVAAPVNNVSGTVKSCCALSLATDATTGNIQAEPGFRDAAAGDFSLLGSSPCVDAGEELPWHAGATDLTGETPRVLQGKVAERVDIGAYEYDPSTAPASISFSVTGGEAVVTPHTATFTLSPEGECGEITSCTWDFGDGESESTDDLDPVSHTYADVGFYTVSVSVETTLRGTLSATNSPAVRIKPSVVFVATNGTHVAPYHTLETAATNITDALKELGYPTDGSRAKVIVADGVYPAPKERITLSTAVEIVGNDADPTAVTIDGENAREFIFLNHPKAFVHGMRFWRGLTSGNAGSADGAPDYSRSPFELCQGVASNCVFESTKGRAAALSAWNVGILQDSWLIGCQNGDGNGSIAAQGGGMRIFQSATCRGCTFTNCTAVRGGAIAIKGGTVENCTFVGNKASGEYGGGVYQEAGTLRGALIVGNTAKASGGGLAQEGGTAVNVTIADNVSPASAGAKVAGTLVNSIVVGKGEYDPANPPLVVSGAGSVRKCCSPSLDAADCLSDDPRFVRREAGNYAIRKSSKCVGFGDNAAWPNLEAAVDLSGQPRLRGLQIDLGGYESNGGGFLMIVR